MAADALVASADELFRAERFSEALEKFERATQVYPLHPLAWKGLGHSLLCLGRPHDAARAFDRAIGLKPESATALWGGAVAHAEIGNKVVAQNYLHRTLALQPTWLSMARAVPQLAAFLQVSSRAANLLRKALGTFSTRAYHRSNDASVALEVARCPDQPGKTLWTYATIGLSNVKWLEIGRPRVELLLATTIDAEVCGQVLANLAFHLGDTGFFPEPGVMVRDVIGALDAGDLSERLPHVYITVPRAWRLSLPLEDGPPPITVAQVVAVSEGEYQRWRADTAAFDAEITRRGEELMDLKRPG
ncbi:MAG TPA: tetratricopeptide repeat protein [Kofleriaceae bacterium]|nr:tetratricopeptide repeat protein [Kofleriaceae bacterium]